MCAQKSFIQEQWEQYTDPEDIKPQDKTNKFLKYLYDRRIRLFALFLIFTLVVPILVFYFCIDQKDYETDDSYTCAIEKFYRVSCGEVNISRTQCLKIKCCYDNNPDGCYYSIPSRYMYISSGNTENTVFKPSQPETPFSTKPVEQLKFNINAVDADILQITLNTPGSYRNTPFENSKYKIKTQKDLLGVEVFRAETDELILTTLRGPLVASEKFWEWTFQLIHEKLYGLGEILLTNKTVTKVIYKNRNDHSTLPSFMAYLKGSFHGVVVEHDGPLEVTVLPSGLIVLRSLAENSIALKLVTGPTPKDVVKQLRYPYEVKPPPYWTLGAHICRDGKTTINSALEEFKTFTQNENTIQFDSDCIHENLYAMLHEEVSKEHDLENLIRDLHEKSHFLMSVPPQILTDNLLLHGEAVKQNVLYKDDKEKILKGYYLEQEAVYPDFSHDSINTWMETLKSNLPAAQVNGYVLRDNWPVEERFEFSNYENKFPYFTEGLNASLSRTIPWNATTTKGERHILHHNKYGKLQVDAFNNYMDHEFLISSSYDHTIQDAVLVQNVNTTWTNLKKTITTTLFHSILGNPLISIPVCGSTNNYNKETNEELCIRWYIVAATMPLLRISSDWPRRDPSNLATRFAHEAALVALERRFRILPYYHTVIRSGEPLVRPMFYDFHFDNETLELDEQYMLGDALLVAQPLLTGAAYVWAYLPPSRGIWYEFWGGKPYEGKGWINMHVVETDWVMFIAQGNIIPMRYSTNRKQPRIASRNLDDTLGFTVGLNCTSDPCTADGSMKLDTATLTFHSSKQGLTISNIMQAKDDIKCKVDSEVDEQVWPSFIEKITIYGLHEEVVFNFPKVDLCKITENETYVEYFKNE